jgi:hypothetical protein
VAAPVTMIVRGRETVLLMGPLLLAEKELKGCSSLFFRPVRR